MATYYWVGGAGTWDATTTTNWATSSGGAGSAGVPTSADNAIFDTLSNATAYAVTVGTNAVAQDITIAGPLSGNVTIALAGTGVINCYGSWLNAATGVVFSTTSGAAINFLATTTGKTVTTNSVALGAMVIVFNGVGGGWILGSAFTTTGTFTVTAGSFDTGNFALVASQLSSSNSNVRAVILGSSALTLANSVSPWVLTTTTNVTLNAGTSTINCSGAAPIFSGGGLTYYNVNFTSTSGNNSTNITGVNTFNNLTQSSPTTQRRIIGLSNNQTITGTLTLGASNAYNARVQVTSNAPGIAFVITAATVATLSDVDFRDITVAGASAPWSGTRLGNGLGNTGITFAAGKTVYWNLVAGGNWSATAWATSSGGAVATANFPLAQDTAIIDNTGLTAGNQITMDLAWWMGTLNVTRTNAWTFACGSSPFIYGDTTLTSATTVAGTANFTFLGQGLTQTFTTNGVSLTTGVIQQSVGGTLVLNGAVTSLRTVTLNNGTLNLDNYTLTTELFATNASNATTLAFGTGVITLTGVGTVFTGSTTCTVTGTPQVICTDNSATARTISPAAVTEANSISFRFTAGTGTISLTAGSYRDLDFTDGTNPTGYAGALGNTSITIYGNFKASTGMTRSAGATTYTFAATSGTKTINTAGVTFDNAFTFNGVGGTWQLQAALTSGATRTITLTSGTLDLVSYTLTTGFFNSNTSTARTLAMGTGKIVVTGNSTTVCTTNTATGLTVTGSRRVEFSTAATTGTRAISGPTIATAIEGTNLLDYYVISGGDTVTFTGSRAYGTIDFYNAGASTFTGTFTNATLSIYGDLAVKSGMTVGGGSNAINMRATSGTKTITSAGQTIDFPLFIGGLGGTFACSDALTLGATQPLTLQNGTLQLAAGTTNTVGSFATTGTTQKFLQSTTPGTQATISAVSGTNTATYLTIQDSNAAGGATWYALSSSLDAGNNTGWIFSPADFGNGTGSGGTCFGFGFRI
jgi:hypothetical protein